GEGEQEVLEEGEDGEVGADAGEKEELATAGPRSGADAQGDDVVDGGGGGEEEEEPGAEAGVEEGAGGEEPGEAMAGRPQPAGDGEADEEEGEEGGLVELHDGPAVDRPSGARGGAGAGGGSSRRRGGASRPTGRAQVPDEEPSLAAASVAGKERQNGMSLS